MSIQITVLNKTFNLPEPIVAEICKFLDIGNLQLSKRVCKLFKKVTEKEMDRQIEAVVLKGPFPGHMHPSMGSEEFFGCQELKLIRLVQKRDLQNLAAYLEDPKKNHLTEDAVKNAKESTVEILKKWGDDTNSKLLESMFQSKK